MEYELMKNIKVLIATALLLHTSSIYADEMKSARSEANMFAANMVNNKFKAIAEMTHPGLVKSFGGVDEYVTPTGE